MGGAVKTRGHNDLRAMDISGYNDSVGYEGDYLYTFYGLWKCPKSTRREYGAIAARAVGDRQEDTMIWGHRVSYVTSSTMYRHDVDHYTLTRPIDLP